MYIPSTVYTNFISYKHTQADHQRDGKCQTVWKYSFDLFFWGGIKPQTWFEEGGPEILRYPLEDPVILVFSQKAQENKPVLAQFFKIKINK